MPICDLLIFVKLYIYISYDNDHDRCRVRRLTYEDVGLD
jgi:hypothetical protein